MSIINIYYNIKIIFNIIVNINLIISIIKIYFKITFTYRNSIMVIN